MAQDVRTTAARRLLEELRKEAREWDDVTTTDAPFIQRHRAEGRRDALDFAIARLRVVLPEVEDEAVDIEVSETARMQAALDAFDAEPLTVWS